MKPNHHDNSPSTNEPIAPASIGTAMLWLWFGAIAPMLAFTLLIVWLNDWTLRAQFTATLAALAFAAVSGWLATRRIMRPIRTVTNKGKKSLGKQKKKLNKK